MSVWRTFLRLLRHLRSWLLRVIRIRGPAIYLLKVTFIYQYILLSVSWDSIWKLALWERKWLTRKRWIILRWVQKIFLICMYVLQKRASKKYQSGRERIACLFYGQERIKKGYRQCMFFGRNWIKKRSYKCKFDPNKRCNEWNKGWITFGYR